MVYSDFDLKEDEVSISGYGFIGKTEFQNGYAVFETSGSLEQVGYMTVFLKFENSPFDAKPALVLDLETIRNSTSKASEDETIQENPEKKLSTGAIVGIVIGSVVGVVIIVILIIVIVKNYKKKKRRRAKSIETGENTAKVLKKENPKKIKNSNKPEKEKKTKTQRVKEKRAMKEAKKK